MTSTQILQKIRSAFYTKAETDALLRGKSDTSHNHNSTYLGIKAKAESAKSADSVAWANVSGKPTIPTVNNATLTIQKNGTTVKTFTANASANVTANITVPTKTSELTNNSGFLTSHSPVDSSLGSTSTNAIQNKVVNATLNSKANDSAVVHKSGNETISGTKTFSSNIVGNGKNVLTEANQIILAKNLSGTKIAPGGVVDCGNGNGKLNQWYLIDPGTFVLASTSPTGVWQNAGFLTMAPNEGGIFIKLS